MEMSGRNPTEPDSSTARDARCRWSRYSLVCASLLLVKKCASFTADPSLGRRTCFGTLQPAPYSTTGVGRRLTPRSRPIQAFAVRDSPFLKDTTASEDRATIAAVQDENGREFVPQCVVRIVASGLKAFQVSPKGRGHFDEEGAFVGHDEPYLALPVGMRGVVTKVYDVDQVSANFPVQVKFVPGENPVGELDAPVPFVMHFLPTEIEVV